MDIQINQAEIFKTLAGFFGREAEPVRLFSPIRRILRRRRWKGRLRLSKEEKEAYEVTRKRFRRRISHAASTPLATRGRCGQGFELSSVCQRLELQFSPTKHEQTHAVLQDSQEASPVGVFSSNPPQEPFRDGKCPGTERLPNQRADWIWRAADQADGNSEQTASDERSKSLQPFSVLNEAGVSLQGKSLMTVGAPSLLNDYYSSLLDCSCSEMIALALGFSVYVWNSETRSVVGRLDPSPDPGASRCRTPSISCLRWSADGRVLCIGNRRGEILLWDIDHNQNMTHFQSHLSVVTAVSWKQQLLSRCPQSHSGSALGHIHHLDPRAPTAVVGSALQNGSVCSLQWSPGHKWLASGSTEGFLHVWDKDMAGIKRPQQSVVTMKQPSAVKAVGWCPWQTQVIATGGGWKDGMIRIWDTQSESCLTSVKTNSQICSLQWAERKKYLVIGHGLPHHQITFWSWEFPSLSQIYQLPGHSQRVLHLAINPDNTLIFSAGADQRFCIWDL